jgi:hypothetical protein
MSPQLKRLYGRYFQKSKSFLYPILDIKKDSLYPPIQTYMAWEGMISITDHKLILTYYVREEKQWNAFLLNVLMRNKLFNEYHEIDDEFLAVSFDLDLLAEDYQKILFGQYSKISKLVKSKIREFYGYSSPEWAYMESFLYPEKYIKMYSNLLDVDESHIRHTGELCDKPNINNETLKLTPHGKNNADRSRKVESNQDIQIDINQQGLSLQ